MQENLQNNLPDPGPAEPDMANSAWMSERTLFALAAGAALLMIAILWQPLFTGRIFVLADFTDLHLPMRRFYSECLKRGESFLWWPNEYCGVYLFAEGQTGMAHPLHYLLYRFLPLWMAFDLEFLLAFPVMLAGMYMFLRRQELRRDAAMFGALVFTFCGYIMSSHTWMHVMQILAQAPWLLWAIDHAMREPDGRRRAAARLGVALLTGSQLLLTHPQHVWFSVILELFYVLSLDRRYLRPGRLAWLGAAKLCGVLLAGIQLIPTLGMAAYAQRLDVTAEVRNFNSLRPVNLLQLACPYIFGFGYRGYATASHEVHIYNSIALLMLCLLIPFAWKRLRNHRRIVVAAILLVFLGISLSFGAYGFLYGLLARLPVVGAFRGPARYFFLTHFAMAILGAVAFQQLVTARGPFSKWLLVMVWLVGAFGLSLGALELGIRLGFISADLVAFGDRVGSSRDALWSICCASGAALAMTFVLLRKRWAPALLILVVAADLGTYGLSYVFMVAPPMTLEQYMATVPDPRRPVKGRVGVPEYVYIAMANKGYRITGGQSGLVPARHLHPRNPAFLRLAGVEVILEPPDQKVFVDAPAPPLPRVRMLTRTTAMPELRKHYPKVSFIGEPRRPGEPPEDPDEDLDLGPIDEVVVLDKEIELPAGAPGEATILSEKNDEIVIRTDAPTRQVLSLSERYDPGWRVTIDGRPGEVLPAYADFMACVVEAGTHTVAFRFQPKDLKQGAWMTLSGAAATLLCFFVSRGRRMAAA